jgi:lon-related putative ATP-dependent protease
MTISELKTTQLCKKINLNRFPFKTTNEVDPLAAIIGQERAVRAIELALQMDHSGYNVFVTGMSGTGRTTIVSNILKDLAKEKAVPDDWIYVYNFVNRDEPQAIRLPSGRAREFQCDMEDLVTTLKKEIPATFDSEEYENQNNAIVKSFNEKKREIMNNLDAEAKEMGIQIQSTPAGFQTVILKDNQPMTSEQLETLSQEEKQQIEEKLTVVQNRINTVVREIVRLDREAQQEIRSLNENVASFIVTRYINELKSQYKGIPEILEYLDRVSEDIITNINEFLTQTRKETEKESDSAARRDLFKRYEVNAFVENKQAGGAPVIYESNPTYNNLFGRIDKQIIMGGQVTDFTMYKPGSLHRANGGYLITEAFHVLNNPYVYDSLKRVIKTREIRTEDVSELYGFVSSAGIRPQPIPLNLKVILIGWNEIYYILQAYDKDFGKIFKIRADFDYETDSTKDNILKYAQFISKVSVEENLLSFHRNAVREIIYYGNRLVDDQKKISLRFGSLVGIIREANYYAVKRNRKYVHADDVKKAIAESEYRHSMIQEKVHEVFKRDIYQIDVEGKKVGEINGLSVSSTGDFNFGRPTKISAKTYIGSESIINIERKARLSGKFHDKGMLILTGFFNSKFGQYIPLAFSGSLTFEQSYSMIDGDSASSTELYALISSLAEVPIKQGVAVTGSVNQHGEVQAIGGVNEKIEGFFRICKEKGLTREQGVIIPKSNIDNLMLKEGVIKAVRAGKFKIWAVDNIEDGLKILTGMDAGQRKSNQKFSKNTIFHKVEEKLRTYARRSSEFKKSIGMDTTESVRRKSKKSDEEEQE